jgi:hypothetical protein
MKPFLVNEVHYVVGRTRTLRVYVSDYIYLLVNFEISSRALFWSVHHGVRFICAAALPP